MSLNSCSPRVRKPWHRLLAPLLVGFFAFAMLLGATQVSLAQTNGGSPAKPAATANKTVACPNGQKGECLPLENPLQGDTTDVTVILGWLIKAALGLMGSLALFMLIWGGFQWLTSAGNSERVEAGTQTMVWAVIGLVVVLSSYVIVTTFIDYLTGAK